MARKTITITLYTSEIIYDVQNKTYLTGRSRATGDNYEAVAHMQANNDDENLNQVLRSIGNAFATLKTKLREYLEGDGTTANNILLDGSSNLTIALKMPSNYNQASNDSISIALHQYIVNMTVADWLLITDKADATEYATLAAANLEQIREAVSSRNIPTRTAISS